MQTAIYHSPAGDLRLAASGRELLMCDWIRSRHHVRNFIKIIRSHLRDHREESDCDTLRMAYFQLDEYFAGTRREFDIRLNPEGSEFQRSVWRALSAIPYGDTCSYSDIARQIGNPRATRGAASAIGLNPISIFIPCHRVISASGTIGGYAGGIPAKESLLRLEAADSGA